MTASLPADGAYSPGRKEALVTAMAGVTLRALPRIPDPVKRLLLAGRTVTVDGNTLDTTVQLMLAGQKLVGIDGGTNNVAAARAQLRDLSGGFRQAIPVAAVRDLTVTGGDGEIPARHYVPPTSTADTAAPLLVFFHGGGFVIGDLDSHDDLCRLICRDAGVHVLSVDYRLAPEHRWPTAAEDLYAATRWASERATEFGADPSRVAVGGDSAGGNLAAVTTLMARDRGEPQLAGQLLLYPVIAADFDTESYRLFGRGFYNPRPALQWYWDQYVPHVGDRQNPYASPLHGDLSGLPPAVVVLAGHDPLRDEGIAYASALESAGVPTTRCTFDGGIHGFMTMPMLDIAHRARRQANSALADLLGL